MFRQCFERIRQRADGAKLHPGGCRLLDAAQVLGRRDDRADLLKDLTQHKEVSGVDLLGGRADLCQLLQRCRQRADGRRLQRILKHRAEAAEVLRLADGNPVQVEDVGQLGGGGFVELRRDLANRRQAVDGVDHLLERAQLGAVEDLHLIEARVDSTHDGDDLRQPGEAGRAQRLHAVRRLLEQGNDLRQVLKRF